MRVIIAMYNIEGLAKQVLQDGTYDCYECTLCGRKVPCISVVARGGVPASMIKPPLHCLYKEGQYADWRSRYKMTVTPPEQ